MSNEPSGLFAIPDNTLLDRMKELEDENYRLRLALALHTYNPQPRKRGRPSTIKPNEKPAKKARGRIPVWSDDNNFRWNAELRAGMLDFVNKFHARNSNATDTDAVKTLMKAVLEKRNLSYLQRGKAAVKTALNQLIEARKERKNQSE